MLKIGFKFKYTNYKSKSSPVLASYFSTREKHCKKIPDSISCKDKKSEAQVKRDFLIENMRMLLTTYVVVFVVVSCCSLLLQFFVVAFCCSSLF